MSGTKISVDQLADAVSDMLDEYSKLADETMRKAVTDAGKTVKNVIREGAPVKSGKYAKSWSEKNTKMNSHALEITVYSRNRYQLAHIGFETSVMLAIAMYFFNADRNVCYAPFLIFLGLYIFAFVVSIIVEFGLRRRMKFNIKNLFIVIVRNLIEDIIHPFWCIKELLSNLLSFITHTIPIKRKYDWYSNKTIVVSAFVYLLITVSEIVIFSKIVGIGFNDWRVMINNGIEWLKQFAP